MSISVTCIAYISEGNEELIIADSANKVIYSIQIGASASRTDAMLILYRLYTCSSSEAEPSFDSVLCSVCHMTKTDTLLFDEGTSLVALQREANVWRESYRVKLKWKCNMHIICALNNARVLCGSVLSKCLCLCRVESGWRIALVDTVLIDKEFDMLSAKTFETDTFVVFSCHSGPSQ